MGAVQSCRTEPGTAEVIPVRFSSVFCLWVGVSMSAGGRVYVGGQAGVSMSVGGRVCVAEGRVYARGWTCQFVGVCMWVGVSMPVGGRM